MNDIYSKKVDSINNWSKEEVDFYSRTIKRIAVLNNDIEKRVVTDLINGIRLLDDKIYIRSILEFGEQAHLLDIFFKEGLDGLSNYTK